MRNIVFLFLFLLVNLYAEDTLRVDEFKVSLFSKLAKTPSEIETSIIFEGRDVQEYDFKIIDALNVVISSFYVEDLLTSQGKESLKKALIEYSRKKYGIDIDDVYIQNLNIVKNITAKVIIDELRKEGYIRK